MDKDRLVRAARAAAYRVALDVGADESIAEDIQALPVIFSERQTRTRMGVFHSDTYKALGRITVFIKCHHTEEELLDTILHEFGHAIVHYMWPYSGCVHGPHWQYIARKLGCRVHIKKPKF